MSAEVTLERLFVGPGELLCERIEVGERALFVYSPRRFSHLRGNSPSLPRILAPPECLRQQPAERYSVPSAAVESSVSQYSVTETIFPFRSWQTQQ
jgi:hypothetical protein